MVAAVVFFILGTDWLIYRQGTRTPFPVAGFQVAIIISIAWFVAGAVAMGMRHVWGRVMVLAILYGGAIGFFVTAIITVGAADGQVAVRLKPLSFAILIYFVAALVVANSRHVRRLTSRVWE